MKYTYTIHMRSRVYTPKDHIVQEIKKMTERGELYKITEDQLLYILKQEDAHPHRGITTKKFILECLKNYEDSMPIR